MKIDVSEKIERLVDITDDKVIDKIVLGMMIVIGLCTSFLFISTFKIFNTFVLDIHPMWMYSVLFILTLSLFYISMLGNKSNKPVYRPKIFLFVAGMLALLTFSLLVEICNYTITKFIDMLLSVAEIPTFLIHTNVRLVTIFIPAFITVLVFYRSLTIPFNKLYKKELLEYTIDMLVRNVDKITDFTIDLKICEDIETGKPVIWTEKNAFRHRLIAGSSGSGKTALSIRPDLAQLFYQKAKFREGLKEKVFQALDDELCYIKGPITNKYLNENFNMKHIGVNEDRKEEFMTMFKDYIIGIRKAERNIYSNIHRAEEVFIPIKYNNDIKSITINVLVYKDSLVYKEHDFTYQTKEDNIIASDDYNIKVTTRSLEECNITSSDEYNYTHCIALDISPVTEEGHTFNYRIEVKENSEGKVIYKDLGISVIAPDGGLSENACEIAAKNGIKVHKIDPKQDEIMKGNIARFNPLLVGEPEKTGDIISSILVSMESSGGKDTNPYFTNASIRAVRNLTILVKVMYPIMHQGESPTLVDILDMLNNFNLVIPYVTKMKEDKQLASRWKSVIDYFETSFYPPVVDEKGKQLPGETIGCNTKKTQEAISGIINQLDNFLGREEIKYILCNREESLNLSEVLENGECIAVSTRQSELGDVLGKAFALMIILSMQNAVLCRYSEDENPEVPHYLFIDEFPFYINDQTKVFFTFARKYKCSVTIAVQNLAQLAEESEVFRETILTNTACKLILPGANVQDREYFTKFLGIEEVFESMTSVTANPVITENAKYSEGMRGQLAEKNKVSEQHLAELKFKRCYYSIVDAKGINKVGKGFIDFMKLTDDNTLGVTYYDYEKFGAANILVDDSNSQNKITRKTISVQKKIHEDKSEQSVKELEAMISTGWEMDSINNLELENPTDVPSENNTLLALDDNESNLIEEQYNSQEIESHLNKEQNTTEFSEILDIDFTNSNNDNDSELLVIDEGDNITNTNNELLILDIDQSNTNTSINDSNKPVTISEVGNNIVEESINSSEYVNKKKEPAIHDTEISINFHEIENIDFDSVEAIGLMED